MFATDKATAKNGFARRRTVRTLEWAHNNRDQSQLIVHPINAINGFQKYSVFCFRGFVVWLWFWVWCAAVGAAATCWWCDDWCAQCSKLKQNLINFSWLCENVTKHENVWRRLPSRSKNIQKINVLSAAAALKHWADLFHLLPFFFYFVNRQLRFIH